MTDADPDDEVLVLLREILDAEEVQPVAAMPETTPEEMAYLERLCKYISETPGAYALLDPGYGDTEVEGDTEG